MAERPILIATDLSGRNDRAVDRAIMLGKQIGQPVCLVHVRGKDAADEESEQRLAAKARASLPDPAVAVDILLPVGSPPDELGRLASERDASMIVSAVARFNGLNDYFVGTAVDRIISRGKKPVLVVKQRPHGDYRKLLVAVDLSPFSAHALSVAAELFPDAEITLLHAYHVPYEGLQKGAHLKDEMRQMREKGLEDFFALPQLAGLKERVAVEFVYGDIGQAILQATRDLQPDLVVAGTHGGAIRRATLGSVASSMLEWVAQDMLIVPPAE